MRRRVLIAGLFHETNTFLERPTGPADFQVTRGPALLEQRNEPSPMGGALTAAADFGWDVLPGVDYRAAPGGLVADSVVESFWSDLEATLRAGLASGLDAAYLVLHGAMVSGSYPDVEGEILRRLRSLDQAAGLPVFGVFDLHANVSDAMIAGADCLVAYHENPHRDARDRAVAAAALLDRTLRTREIPRMVITRPGLLWPPTGTATADTPMRELEAAARLIERENPSLWSVNVVPGFSFADTPDTGVSFSAATTGDPDQALAALEPLNALAIRHRNAGCPAEAKVDEVVAALPALGPGLTVVAEPSDNIGAGAPGDGTGLLRAFVRHQTPNAALALNDPAAVAQLARCASGESLILPLGGRGSRLDPGPLPLEVTLVSRSDGRFRLEDPRSHLASMSGSHFDMGPCAVVRHRGLTLLLTSRPTPPFDLGQWRSQGIDPERFSVIGVKAAVAHRRAYEPIAARLLSVDTPGPCSSRLRAFPYRHLRRPIWPLDS